MELDFFAITSSSMYVLEPRLRLFPLGSVSTLNCLGSDFPTISFNVGSWGADAKRSLDSEIPNRALKIPVPLPPKPRKGVLLSPSISLPPVPRSMRQIVAASRHLPDMEFVFSSPAFAFPEPPSTPPPSAANPGGHQEKTSRRLSQ